MKSPDAKSPYVESPAKFPNKGAGIAASLRDIKDAIERNKAIFREEINKIIESTSLTIDQKTARIGAEIVKLERMAGQKTVTNGEFIDDVNTALKIDLKKAGYIKAGKQYLAQQELAQQELAVNTIAKAGGLAFVKKFKMTRAQQETKSVASSSTGLSKPAIALISLAVVAVGAAVVSYLTIPAAAIAMSTFASWITLQALPTAGLFLASKTGISALAITATVGLAVLALRYFSQSKSDESLQIESSHTGTQPNSNEISGSKDTVSSVVNDLVSSVVDANRAKEGVKSSSDPSTATLKT